MADLRAELTTAFPLAPVPQAPLDSGRGDAELARSLLGKSWREVDAISIHRRPKVLMELTSTAFRYYLAAWLMASIEDPGEPDLIPALVVAAIANRRDDARALAPAQRKVVAKYVAMHANDADLRGGNLLAALENLSQ